jgi:hypothetical protein
MLEDVRLSWSFSEATPPQTMAPRLPFPIGAASVKCSAGDENTTFSGRSSSSITRRARIQSPSMGGAVEEKASPGRAVRKE